MALVSGYKNGEGIKILHLIFFPFPCFLLQLIILLNLYLSIPSLVPFLLHLFRFLLSLILLSLLLLVLLYFISPSFAYSHFHCVHNNSSNSPLIPTLSFSSHLLLLLLIIIVLLLLLVPLLLYILLHITVYRQHTQRQAL